MPPFVGGAFRRPSSARSSRTPMPAFGHPAVTPLGQLGANDWLLELFHGPTLAFKDVAMQLLGAADGRRWRERGERVTIVGATSGDTGGAAIEAFRGRDAHRGLHPLPARPGLARCSGGR